MAAAIPAVARAARRPGDERGRYGGVFAHLDSDPSGSCRQCSAGLDRPGTRTALPGDAASTEGPRWSHGLAPAPLPMGHAGPTAWLQRCHRRVTPVPRPGTGASIDESRRYHDLGLASLYRAGAAPARCSPRLQALPSAAFTRCMLAFTQRLAHSSGEALPPRGRGLPGAPERFGYLSREVRLPLPRGSATSPERLHWLYIEPSRGLGRGYIGSI
jgi:hypothetical protein